MDIDTIFNFSLPSSMRAGFPDSYFETIKVGTSDCSEYIPAFALFGHELHVFENEDKTNRVEVMEYHMPTPRRGYEYRQYHRLILELKSATYPSKFIFKVAGVTHSINVFRGIVCDEHYNILMCLGLKSDYVMSVTRDVIRSSPDADKMMLFISDKFSEDKYKNLRKKLEVQYISLIRDANIDVIETKKIDKWLYSNNFKAPNFKSIMEMKKHLREEVPKLILEV